MVTRRHQGPLTGEVVGTADPRRAGRLRVRFPVTDLELWCEPALPPGTSRSALPEVGSLVLVVWLNNDVDDRAYWVAVVPTPYPGADDAAVLARTPAGVTIRLLVHGETVEVSSSAGPAVVLDGTAVTVSNGQGAHLVLDGPSVDINHGALVVT